MISDKERLYGTNENRFIRFDGCLILLLFFRNQARVLPCCRSSEKRRRRCDGRIGFGKFFWFSKGYFLMGGIGVIGTPNQSNDAQTQKKMPETAKQDTVLLANAQQRAQTLPENYVTILEPVRGKSTASHGYSLTSREIPTAQRKVRAAAFGGLLCNEKRQGRENTYPVVFATLCAIYDSVWHACDACAPSETAKGKSAAQWRRRSESERPSWNCRRF